MGRSSDVGPMSTPESPWVELRREAMSSRSVKGAAVQTAKNTAVRSAMDKAASKGLPLKGVEQLSERPGSLKVWITVAGRSAVSAGLSYLGLGKLGSWAEDVIHRIGYKRLIVIIAISAVMTFVMSACAVMMFVASISDTVLKPVGVVASLLGTAPDKAGGASENIPKNMCRPAPAPRSVGVTEIPETAPLEDGAETDVEGPGVGGFTPESVFNEDGRLTESATSLMKDIPRGTPSLLAETWMLYVMAHPRDDPSAQWEAFVTTYDYSKAFVSHHKTSDEVQKSTSPDTPVGKDSQTEKDSPVEVSPIEIVMNMDSGPFYDAFTLAAATMTASLVMDNYVTADDQDKRALSNRMESLCGV